MRDDTGDSRKRKRWIVLVSAAAAAGLCALVGLGVLAVLGPPMVADALAAAAGGACSQEERTYYADVCAYAAERDAGTTLALPPLPAGEGPVPAYFGRDLQRFPLAGLPGDGTEPLIACNPKALEHHPDAVHVLYADGAVEALPLAELEARGAALPDTAELVVGPGSAHEVLRKLRRE